MKFFTIRTTLFFVLIAFTFNALGQNFTVKRGERPSIDLKKVPKGDYEHNALVVKFKPTQTKAIEQFIANSRKSSTAVIGIAGADALNREYKVKAASSYFLSDALKSTFSERHKAWGFHLWVKLDLQEDADIVEMADAYQALPEVELAEPIYKKRLFDNVPNKAEGANKGSEAIEWTPNDPRFNEQWHYHNTGQQSGTADCDIDLPEAWEIETGNSGLIVAIVDQGIQYTHPDLAANMWSGIGYNFTNNTSTIQPGDHGTHVAGTVAAVNDNGLGVAGIAGGTGSGDGVRLMSCQVFVGNTGGGGFHLAPIFAADNGASISQNSWGYSSVGQYEQSVLDAIDYFNVNGGGDALDGGITIFAAGNDNASGQWFPGCYSGAFSVAGTNNKDQKSWYSNYDTWVDISAPGGETNSVNPRGVLSTVTSNNYAFYQGTSMACPHTSGVAALIISLAYGQLSNGDVADILKSTTDDHYASNPGFIGKLGSGRLNAHKALLETQSYISGVLNPKTFSATATGTTSIALNWSKNNDENPVIVLWSGDGVFGQPVNGTNYTIGQTIPGGGTILYLGSDTSFSHSDLLSNTKYYYKALSYNLENLFSSGKQTSAWTFCDIISILPYTQNFNESNGVPNCWNVVDNEGSSQVWQFGTMSSGLNGTSGNYAFVNSDGYGFMGKQNTDLISPVFNLSAYESVMISFKHYFRSYSTSAGKFSYSINGGTSWVLVKTWNANSANPENYEVTIAELSGQPNVLFKWNYTGTYAYYWCVDDISITGFVSGGNATISFNPQSLNKTLAVGEIATQNLSVINSGNVPLAFILETATNLANQLQRPTPSGTASTEGVLTGYCVASTTNQDEFISRVQLAEIDNSSAWQVGVANYTDQYALMNAGESMPITVTNGNPWPNDRVSVWVDWDQDFVFGSGNEAFVLATNNNSATFTGNIIAPAETPAGDYRMRIRMTYNTNPEPCGSASYGEIEDYTIRIGQGGQPDSWLSALPLNGTIAPGQSMNITVTYNATSLIEGTYTGSLNFSSNATNLPQASVGVTLTVSPVNELPKPQNLQATAIANTVELSWSAPDFGGGSYNLIGYRIYRNGQYVNQTASGTTTYLDSQVAVGTYTYGVTAVYGEPGAGESDPVTVDVTVNPVLYPAITVNPEALQFWVPLGGSTTQPFAIGNTGQGPLNWTTNVQYVSQLVNIEPVPAGPKPVPGILELSRAGALPGGEPETDTRGSVVLNYDGENSDAIGLTNGGSFSVAARFPSAMVAQYAGYTMQSVNIYINDVPNPATLKIWGAGSASAPGTVLHQQNFTATASSWNTITLTAPVSLTGQDIWVGYTLTHAGGEFPAGCDAGPANPNGDFISTDGTAWDHLAGYGLDYSWNIRALISGDNYSWLSLSANSGTVAAGGSQNLTATANSTGLSAGSYFANIQIASNDPDMPVKTVPAELHIGVGLNENSLSEISVYPIPVRNELTIKLVQGIKTMCVINYLGQIVEAVPVGNSSIMTYNVNHLQSGAYILQFINNKGEYFNKRILISR